MSQAQNASQAAACGFRVNGSGSILLSWTHEVVAPSVHAMMLPGLGLVKQQSEEEAFDQPFIAAGFAWREPG